MSISDYEIFGVMTSGEIQKPPSTASPPPGVYANVPAAQYHAWRDPDGFLMVSATALKQFAKSAAHYWHWCNDPEPAQQSAAMRFGELCHSGSLEPEALENTIAVIPGDLYDKVRTRTGKVPANPAATDEGRAVLATWEKKQRAKGRRPVTEAEFRQSLDVQLALRTHPEARAYLDNGFVELSIVWDDLTTGMRCKARLDLYQPGHDRAVDLKTCQDASPGAFAGTIARYGYHLQAAHYVTGMRHVGYDAQRCGFVAVESKRPHGVSAGELSVEALGTGQRLRRRLLNELHECRDRDRWPSYQFVGVYELPRWACDDVGGPFQF